MIIVCVSCKFINCINFLFNVLVSGFFIYMFIFFEIYVVLGNIEVIVSIFRSFFIVINWNSGNWSIIFVLFVV